MPRVIPVLDVVPELTEGLAGEELALVRRTALASTQTLPRGPWEDRRALARVAGGIVRNGLLVRDAAFAGAVTSDLIGPGDLLLAPSDRGGAATTLTAAWHALEPTTILWLGPAFERAAQRWPTLNRSLLRLAQERLERATALQAIAQLQRIDDRVIALLWHLADRWGRVTGEGVIVPLNLTHRVLAGLIGARRPSVTTALGKLAADGRLGRRDDGSWLLTGDVPGFLAGGAAPRTPWPRCSLRVLPDPAPSTEPPPAFWTAV